MARPTLPIEMVAGDTLPQLIVQCWDAHDNGSRTPQNLAGYTFSVLIVRPDPHSLLERTGDIVDPALGKVVFSWESGDWVEGFAQKAFITQVDPAGKKRSFGEFTFNVTKAS
jgi:hypothetical protein